MPGLKFSAAQFFRTSTARGILRSPAFIEASRQRPSFSVNFTVQRGGIGSAPERSVDRNDPNGIDERSFRFFVDVLGFVDTIQKGPKTNRLIEQLVDSVGSIGGNREEALGASSRKEFIRFNEIALRSANETVRWLRACAAKQLGSQEQCVALLDEARQLTFDLCLLTFDLLLTVRATLSL